MIEFIPYLVILFGWHPDHPGKFVLEKRELFPSQAACEEYGEEAVEARKMYDLEYGGMKFFYFCVPSASADELEEAWQTQREEIEQRRLERQSEDEAPAGGK